MVRLPVVSSATGIWPIVSYLHVPKAMPQAQWLMLGTAFALDKPSLKLDPAFAAKHDVLLLTAAHTLAPWRCFQVNIPDEWRKSRYVIGKIMQYDSHGSGDITRMCNLDVVAVHPTVDVALLRLAKPQEFRKHCHEGPANAPPLEAGETEGLNDVSGTFRLVAPPFPADAKPSDAITALCLGFRGRGGLGGTEQLSEADAKKLTQAEREQKIQEHRHAVGKQDFNVAHIGVRRDPPVTDVPPLVPTAEGGDPKAPASSIYSRGQVLQGACFAGMSGSPLVLPPVLATPGQPRDACGLLFQRGLLENRDSEVLYVPSDAIIPWLESLK
jgi:hypothetical protein